MAGPVNEAKTIRRALLLILLGLVIEAFCVRDIKPDTFLVFALVGAPLVLLGIAMYLRLVWRVLRKTGGL